MEYLTVSASSKRELDLQVMIQFGNGWKLYGNPYSMGNTYNQAMTHGDYRSKPKK